MAFSGIEEFLKAHNTTLQAVEAAYKAAEEDFLQAHAARRTPVLIHAIEPPRVKNDRYAAVTGPLGYNSTPINEPVWQGSIVAWGRRALWGSVHLLHDVLHTI